METVLTVALGVAIGLILAVIKPSWAQALHDRIVFWEK